jgi:cbb3-type cytochrome oxidase subunit 3
MDETNYGKKGGCFVLFLVFVILFILLLIWVYNMNNEALGLLG